MPSEVLLVLTIILSALAVAVSAFVALRVLRVAPAAMHAGLDTRLIVVEAILIRRPGLVVALQRECRIMVAGPTTLVSLLMPLRMGFRSLAIQKRSSEVWKVLSAVKAEFGNFEKVMGRVDKTLQEAQNVVEEVGVRRRAMGRKLRGVESLPEIEAAVVLELQAAATADVDAAPDAAD